MRKVLGANRNMMVDCAGHRVTLPIDSDFDEMDKEHPAAESCGVETTERGVFANTPDAERCPAAEHVQKFARTR
jgi:hypothetical protein